MRIIGILISFIVTIFLTYILAKDYSGAKAGDGKERTLTPVQTTESVVKKLETGNSPLKDNFDKAAKSE